MKDFIKVLQRFLPPYKGDTIMMFVYNLLGAVFGVFSLGAIVPVLDTFFNKSVDVSVIEKMPWELKTDVLAHNFNYYITLVKNEYGAEYTLFFIAGVALTMVFFKVLFTFWVHTILLTFEMEL